MNRSLTYRAGGAKLLSITWAIVALSWRSTAKRILRYSTPLVYACVAFCYSDTTQSRIENASARRLVLICRKARNIQVWCCSATFCNARVAAVNSTLTACRAITSSLRFMLASYTEGSIRFTLALACCTCVSFVPDTNALESAVNYSLLLV